MNHLPVFFSVADRPCLVVGGGPVAARKVALLRRAGARVTVVAPRIGDELAALAADGRIAWVPDRFAPADVDGYRLVHAATGEEATDRAVAAAARAAGIPVNVADDGALSDFITPAVVDRSPVVVAVSSGGAAPVLARRIRAVIEALLPADLGRLAERAAALRRPLRRAMPSPSDRHRFWRTFLSAPRAGLPGFAPTATDDARGHVAIVGAGPGDPDLLTLRALQRLQEADVIVHDRLIGPRVLDYARRDAERIDVGKARGRQRYGQAEICALLAHHAGRGRRVVRLKGGDPFVFGRGGEEQDYLRRRGIAVEIVPGISAALGAAAAVGMPLTHRGAAQAVTFITGAAAGGDGLPGHDWAALARTGTLVVYMGVENAARIAERLIAHGLPAATPAAAIENATLPTQRLFVGSLGGLGEMVAVNAVKAPALLVIGEVARQAAAAAAPVELAAVS